MGISDALGLSVDMHAVFANGESGRIFRDGSAPSGYRIETNGAHSLNRQRFTLAHEIAHFLLHRNQIGDGIVDNALYCSRLGNHMETEANRLVAELLMPAHLMRILWRSGIRSLAQLCNTFEVSEAALRIRLTQLRLDA
jgi:Zn-dependent peptidase ImmA (M78 family)